MFVDFEAYHGTSQIASSGILTANYEPSLGDEEWLGDGVYFFVPGISSKLEELSEKWAKAQAWDNKAKKYSYDEYCILKSKIQVHEDNFLDLTIEDGVEVFQYLLERFKDKISQTDKKISFYDGLLINLARGEEILEIDVVKGNFYIKFTAERIERINLRTSNCTICAVYNPTKNIIDTKIVKTGRIDYETY